MSDSKQQESASEGLKLVGAAAGMVSGGVIGTAAGLALLSVVPVVGLLALLVGPTICGCLGAEAGYQNPKGALLGLAGTIAGIPTTKSDG